MMTARTIFGIFGTIFGVLFIIESISKNNDKPRWTSSAFFFAGLCSIIWSIIIFIQLYGLSFLSTTAFLLLNQIKTLLAGFIVGILFVLMIAGQLKITKKLK